MRGVRSATAVITVLALPACSALPRTDTVDSLTRQSVTPQGATAVVAHYNAVAAGADRRLAADPIAGVQTGDLLRQTQAAYKIGRLLKKPFERASTFTVDSVGAPEYGGYPMRFVASGNQRVGVWERASAGAAWRLSYSVPPSAGASLPELTGVREVAPSSALELAESPAGAAAKLAELLTVGTKSANARLFAPTPELTKLLKNLADSHAVDPSGLILAVTDTFTVNSAPVAFRTTNGEVLAFATLTDENVMRPRFGAMWPVGQNTAAFSTPNHLYRNALTTTSVHQFALAIPMRKDARIRVLGFTTQLVDAGGY
ncbi:hypothetical protein [Kribbella sp. HUAS MG21]|uniref:DUF8094 domain-containing protein n=1 Tax=Kribbella sp. HUAS MG21 TaxID=3160966 RepID=A0AAU7T958_9ACTN